MLAYHEEERPISIQVFGYDIERMVESAKRVQDLGAEIIDINCGCPAPKVVKRGGGCELMRQPEHLGRMLSAVREAVSIPLTLKIRSGWDDENRNAMQIALMAQECGVDMLAVHGRTRTALYRGEADWSIVREIADALKIPVVGSGDVVDVESARAALQGGVAALMIGRGAMSNPWVCSEIQAGLEGRSYDRPSDLETVRVLKSYMELLREQMHDRAVIGRMKQFASQVTRRVSGSTEARRSLCLSKSVEEFERKLDTWGAYLEQESRSLKLSEWSEVFSDVRKVA
jgi:nifR3 family TIM-barrel protein